MTRIAGYISQDVERSHYESQKLIEKFRRYYNCEPLLLRNNACVLVATEQTSGVETVDNAIVFDGFIYNTNEIDCLITARHGISDVERFSQLVSIFGVEGAVKKINGDFSVAIFDKKTGFLWLLRDRFGVRPLYYSNNHLGYGFASEIKLALIYDGVSRDVNRRFVATFAGGHYRHIDNRPDESPFRDVSQLPAAHYIKINYPKIIKERYWDLSEKNNFSTNEKELSEEYRGLLSEAVAIRFDRASAPAFTLSGGLDSSSILSCAVNYSGEKQTAFSSVYVDPTFDESEEIRTVLDTKVSNWIPINIGNPDVISIVKKMVYAHDEPVATATWLSHYLLCQEACQKGYKTIFGGLGGDELNAGEYEYFFYLFADLESLGDRQILNYEINEWARHHDHPIYRKSLDIVEETLIRVIDRSISGRCLPDVSRMKKYSHTINKDYFDLDNDQHQMDHRFTSYLKNRTYQDLFRETTPCCLRAEDRQTHHFGLTHMDPFLDHRLAEFMFRVPGILKIRDGITKRLLREAMKGILPEETRARIKKTGWNAPAHKWFSVGQVADEVSDIIHSAEFSNRGIYNIKEVRKLFSSHKEIVDSDSSAENHMMFIWQLLNLEIWFREVVSKSSLD